MFRIINTSLSLSSRLLCVVINISSLAMPVSRMMLVKFVTRSSRDGCVTMGSVTGGCDGSRNVIQSGKFIATPGWDPAAGPGGDLKQFQFNPGNQYPNSPPILR